MLFLFFTRLVFLGMGRRNRMSSRTVISNRLHDEQCVDRSGKTPINGDMPADNANIAALPSSGNSGKRRLSKRQKFFLQFQDIEGQLTSHEPTTVSQYHENEAAAVSNLCDRAASIERYVNSASQRFFQQFEAPQPEMTGHATTCDVDEVMPAVCFRDVCQKLITRSPGPLPHT